jgi:hypothetical protein
MPAMSVPDMIEMVRILVDDEDAMEHQDADILKLLNQAQGFYDLFLYNNAKKAMVTSQDITHDGTTELTRIAPYMPRIVSAEIITDNPRSPTLPIEGGFDDRWRFLSLDGSTYSRYYVQNNQIGIIPVPSSSVTNRIWYVLRSPELHHGIGQAISGTTVTLTADITATDNLGNLIGLDDAYNDIPIMFTAVEAREVNYILDYVTSTRVATCSSTWVTTADSTPAYSLLPRLDPESHMLLVYWAVKHSGLRTRDNMRDIDAERGRLEAEYLSYIRIDEQQSEDSVFQYGW